MESATTLPNDNVDSAGAQPHFVIELLQLIGRIVATALVLNIVFAGIILLLAGQAEAASTAAVPGHNANAVAVAVVQHP